MLSQSFSLNTFGKIKNFKKSITVDADKSISIRSFLLGAISNDISNIQNVLESEDVFSTIKSLKKLGIKIIKNKKKCYTIYGKGLGSLFIKKNSFLDFGNSGTLARLLTGILATNPNINILIKGDKSLNKRSMKKLIKLMEMFGAEFYPKNKFNFPLKLISSELPIGIKYTAGVSAQLKSAVILAGLNSFGNTVIIEKNKSRDHTENMLIANSKVLKIIKKKENTIKVFGKNYLKPLRLKIPNDPSSAAFFVALTLLNNKSNLRINNLGLNPRRIGFYRLLIKHGAKINFLNIKKVNNEIIGDVYVKSSTLKPIRAGSEYYVSSTDEYPILFVIAALTKGVSIFKGIKDLANKESNRIIEMKKILNQIGVKCISDKKQMKIFGKKEVGKIKKEIQVPNLGDHRICMSAVILSLSTGLKSKIKNFETVRTSSPSFLSIIKSLGGKFEIKKTS